jgi:hypothetical protein
VALVHSNLDGIVCDPAIVFEHNRRRPDPDGPELDVAEVDTLDLNDVGVRR